MLVGWLSKGRYFYSGLLKRAKGLADCFKKAFKWYKNLELFLWLPMFKGSCKRIVFWYCLCLNAHGPMGQFIGVLATRFPIAYGKLLWKAVELIFWALNQLHNVTLPHLEKKKKKPRGCLTDRLAHRDHATQKSGVPNIFTFIF